MRIQFAFIFLPLSAAVSTNIVLGNDDGWAEVNIRTFYNALKAAGNSIVLSAPASNQSGRGSLDAPPIPLLQPCEFESCPIGSPAYGANASVPRFNYVNSFPLTAIKYGINTLAPKFFSGKPALALAGPNVGANLGLVTEGSGTVGAAAYAANNGIPAVAFSGSTGSQTAWNVSPVPDYSLIYAQLSTKFTQALLAASTLGGAILPPRVYINVNYAKAGSGTSCTNASQFKFVLTRINDATLITPHDVANCGRKRLPTETSVLNRRGGCFASVSVGNSLTKGDSGSTQQAAVLKKLNKFLSC